MIAWTDALLAQLWQAIPLAALLCGSAFFSATETALFNLSRGELHRMAAAGAAGRLVVALMRQPRRTLNVLLFANMVVNVAFAAASAVMVLDLRREGLSGWGAGVASLVPLLALIFLGEVCPKTLAFVYSPQWALLSAGPLVVVRRVLGPVVWLVEMLLVWPMTRLAAPRTSRQATISAPELEALLNLSAQRGVIDHDANALLQEIVDLPNIRAGTVMVPRVDVIAHDVNAPRAALVKLLRRTHLRRIPVYDGDLDHLLGVVHAKRVLLNPDVPIRELLRPLTYLPEAANLERALLQLREKRTQMAIVVDEYGGTAGLITLEDILEQIVGDIPDPRGAVRGPAVQRVGEDEYLLDADLSIHEWSDVFETDLDSTQIRTVGGFVMALLGRVPMEGDEATFRNLSFRVESVRGRRIGRIRLRLKREDR
jgi:putative hemolysin